MWYNRNKKAAREKSHGKTDQFCRYRIREPQKEDEAGRISGENGERDSVGEMGGNHRAVLTYSSFGGISSISIWFSSKNAACIRLADAVLFLSLRCIIFSPPFRPLFALSARTNRPPIRAYIYNKLSPSILLWDTHPRCYK